MTNGCDAPGPERARDPDAREHVPWEWRRPQFRFRLRTLMLAVAVVAVWLPVVFDPVLGRLIGGALVLSVSALLAALGTTLLGLGLSALGDRVVAWVRRVGHWPDEQD